MNSRPSWQHQIVAKAFIPAMGMRRSNAPERLQHTIDVAAKKSVPILGKKALRGLTATSTERNGWKILTYTPTSAASKATMICIHGGAYVYDVTLRHLAFYADLARDSDVTVVIPLYPVAPRGTAGTVVPEMADLISEVIAASGADAVVVQGESAGGGLALAAVQELVKRDASVPARLILLSPWLDVTVSDPRSQTIKDPMLDYAGIIECGRMWAGDLPTNHPMASPLYGSLSGLPPITVFSGTLDLIYPDSVRLAEKAANEHTRVDLDLRDGLIHVWAMLDFLPEGAEAAKLINRQLKSLPR
ncbi:alpha/beta hydrolase [Arthrobacter agilis]|uniref:alpha/beta hydrolase n=1 Tax=Arthrobacter agilis TaxID=37921 RepID=UPI0027807414|nr:alpha/beta hydrolase [Arthrobacter agilis]MDQ0734735.1 triacylglycerol lipase [Arthrobacter agilis]